MQRCAVILLSLLLNASVANEAPTADRRPADIRTGFFRISLTPAQLMGEQGAAAVADLFAAEEPLEWQLYVPPGYDADAPPGAVVYVSPYRKGGPPKAWNAMLGDNNLIWIGAQDAGNDVPVSRRMFLALFAPMVLERSYAIDANRVYIAGFSGGGKAASRVAVLRPNVFRGGIFLSGAVHWGPQAPPLIDELRKQRYLFLSGSNDSALKEVQRAHKKFKDDGVTGAKLSVLGNHRHSLPEAREFERAVDYLDSRLRQGRQPARRKP